MKKAKKAAIAALACTIVLGTGTAVFAGCSSCNPTEPETVHDDIVNGGFEQGDFTGWKVAGDFAFDADGVVEEEAIEGLGVTVTGKVGKYYFNGLAATNATATGTLTSEPFKLGGTGKIGFKVGSGSDAAKCYIEFIENGTNTVLKKVSNEAYDEGFIDDDLVRVVVDLSEHIGKDIYIKVTDNGSTQKSHEYLHLDDFVMYKTEAEITAANKERNDYIKMYGRPVFENDTPDAKTVKNGNFEDGLNNWLVLDGDAFTPRTIKSSSEKFWDTREYNAEGEYFLDGFAVGEERGGAIRSTTFTLGETGIISFLLSSANHNTIYVAVCNEEAIGDIAKDTELFKVSAKEVFKDNELSENMLRRYINASSYTPEEGEAVSLLGKKLYIKLVDGREGGDFGAVCFDDVRCSMTEEEVLALEKADYEWAMALTGRGAEEIKYTQNYYSNYNYPIALPVIRFSQTAAGVALKAGNTEVDVTAYIADVKASYGEADESEFTYKVTKVNYKNTDITTNLDKVVFDTVGFATVTYEAKYEDKTLEGTFIIDITNANQVSNGGFETGNLAGWTVTEGEVNLGNAVSGAEFGWSGASYNHSGNYHFDGMGSAAEDKTYTVKSTDFVLGGAGVISFKLGGRAATLRVYDKTSGVCLAEYKNTAFADVEHAHVEKGNRSLTMTTYYADLSQYIGMTLYIELADTETSNWGVAHFDDIITYYEGDTETVLSTLIGNTDTVKYTCEGDEKTTDIAWIEATNNITPELVQIMTKVPAYKEFTSAQSGHDLTQYLEGVTGAVIGVTDPTIEKAITKVSEGTNQYTEGFDAFNLEAGKIYTVTYTLTYNDGTEDYTTSAEFVIKVLTKYDIQNNGFETGDLTGWTYTQGTGNGQIKGDVALSSDETFWNEKIPFNKSGNFFFNGWNANETESNGYTLKSSVFELGGSGFISFKMGGNAAAVRVYYEGGNLLAEYRNTEFADVEFPHVEKGGRWATMTTFVADLHEYLGLNLYIELVDTGAGAWGVAFFDDIITYYETAPVVAEKYDNVIVYCEDPEGEVYEMPWVEAENSVQPELISIVKKANGYNELTSANANCDLTQYISDVAGAVVGVTNPTISKAITKVSDGTNEYTTGFNAFNLETGKSYTVTYTLTYNDGTEDYTASAEFIIKVLTQYEIQNGGFELGTLSGWTYVEGTGEGKIAGESALSTDETHWGERIPHNKSGNYFFNGWTANPEEGCAYSIKSSNFTLGGAGVISFKLGGNATVLKVFKTDGTQIAAYSNTEFADKNFPHVEQGGRWGTMTTFYADLHEYVGEQLYIELHDIGNPSGWGVAFFDDIVTYYEGETEAVLETLAENKDTVNIYCEGDGDTTDIDWVLAENEYGKND